jgi:hypothetical protein
LKGSDELWVMSDELWTESALAIIANGSSTGVFSKVYITGHRID